MSSDDQGDDRWPPRFWERLNALGPVSDDFAAPEPLPARPDSDIERNDHGTENVVEFLRSSPLAEARREDALDVGRAPDDLRDVPLWSDELPE